SATRSRGSRLEANSSSCSGVVSTRPAERTSPPSAIATSQKSRCTSNPIALPALLTSSSPLVVELAEKQRANDNDRYVLTAHPGSSLQAGIFMPRVLAAYGGVFVVGSLVWGVGLDGFRPDRFDLLGTATCLLGASIIMWAPR